jgi:hypothetical protein
VTSALDKIFPANLAGALGNPLVIGAFSAIAEA